MKSGADMVISGHVHAYERLGPVYNNVSMECEVETQECVY